MSALTLSSWEPRVVGHSTPRLVALPSWGLLVDSSSLINEALNIPLWFHFERRGACSKEVSLTPVLVSKATEGYSDTQPRKFSRSHCLSARRESLQRTHTQMYWAIQFGNKIHKVYTHPLLLWVLSSPRQTRSNTHKYEHMHTHVHVHVQGGMSWKLNEFVYTVRNMLVILMYI